MSNLYVFLLVNLPPGTEILTVQAADNDDPKTDNVRIFYRLVGQIPESPRALFRVDRDSGVISVQADSMEGTAPQYTLTITAEDAKGDFDRCKIKSSSYCDSFLTFSNLTFSYKSVEMLFLLCNASLRNTELALVFPVAEGGHYIRRKRLSEIKII